MKAYNDDNRFFNLRSDVYFKHFFSVGYVKQNY